MRGRHLALVENDHRKLVILNQAVNYLTIGLANAFCHRFDSVTLLTGNLHVQGEPPNPKIKVHYICQWHERPAWRKAVSYVFGLLQIWFLLWTKYRKHEVLFVSVPPMGYLLNLVVRNRFSMVIWDLYPDTLKIAGMSERHPIYRTWSWLNRRSFRSAFRMYTISETLADAISAYVPRERLIVHPIWAVFPDNSRIPPQENLFIKEHDLDGKFIVQYSGNIGLTHNVEFLIELADKLQSEPDVLFQIIGRGPRLPRITQLVAERKLVNVQLLPFQSDEMFPHSLSAANLGVVILDEKVSRGSVPSKAFNLMGLGIPSLYIAGPDSQLAQYASEFGHARCYAAGELEQAADFIRQFARNTSLQNEMSLAATRAAENFRPRNAERFVESYFDAP